MAQAYTPGLQITEQTRIVRVRELPLQGKALVSVGDAVSANQDVLSAELPGDLEIVRIADRLGIEPDEVESGLQVRPGVTVTEGQLLCEVKTFFGLFTQSLKSPLAGTVEFFTSANGHIGIRRPSVPMTVKAYIDGHIVEVVPGHSVTIESNAAILQGIFGVGGEQLGTVRVLDVGSDEIVNLRTLEKRKADLPHAILIGGMTFSVEALRYAALHHVSAVVTGSVDAVTLREFVGYEIGVSITGDEPVPFSFIITEGFGALPISERAMALAKKTNNKAASANGTTQVRAGAVRPEVIIPNSRENQSSSDQELSATQLAVGAPVRVIRVPYFGKLGIVEALPPSPTLIPTGALVRVASIRLDSGETVLVPRANLELL